MAGYSEVFVDDRGREGRMGRRVRIDCIPSYVVRREYTCGYSVNGVRRPPRDCISADTLYLAHSQYRG